MTDKKPKKPAWAIERDRARKEGPAPVWLFGLHAVRDALCNEMREKMRLVLTKNAADRLGDVISGHTPEIVDPRKFPVPLDPGSVHQGAAVLVRPLNWGSLEEVCATGPGGDLVVMLDRVTDPGSKGTGNLRGSTISGV